MALEDTLGSVPPDTYDTVENTNNLDQLADQKLSVDPATTRTRMARKGLVGASDVADPIESTHQLTLKAREMIDKLGQTQADQPSTANYDKYGAPIDDPYGRYGAPTAQTATPAAPAKEGGGVSASDEQKFSGYLPTAGKGLARGAINTAGGQLQGLGIAAGGAENVPQAIERGDQMVDPASGMMVPTGAPATPTSPTAIRDNPLYQAGQSVKQFGERNVPMTKAEQESLTGRVAQGVGGLGAMVPGIMAGSALGGPIGGVAAGAAQMGLSAAADTFDTAIEKGASEDNAAKAAGLSGAVNAALGTIPLGVVLRPIKAIAPELAGVATAALAKVGLSPELMAGRVGGALKGAGAFATIGEAQEYLGDAIARAYYDPKQEYSLDTKRVIASLITGGLFGAIFHAAPAKAAQEAPPASQPPAAPGIEGNGPQAGGPSGGAGPEAGPQPGAGPQAGRAQYDPQQPGAAWSGLPPNPDHAKGSSYQKLEKVLRYYKFTEPQIQAMSFQDMFDMVRWHATRKGEYPQPGGAKADAEQPAAEQPKQEQAAPEAEATTGPRPGTREAPIKVNQPEDVLKAGEIATEPTPGQAQAENYQHAHVELEPYGLTGKNGISIETPVGGTRKGPVDEKTGQPAWQTPNFPAAYGRIKGTKGADGQPIDVFLGSGGSAYILDQKDPKTGKFDEHKVMIGYPTAQDAKDTYLASYDQSGPNRIMQVTPVTAAEFKEWLANGDKMKPYVTPKTETVGETTTGPSGKGKSGFDKLNEMFGGEEETPKPTVTAADKPTAEPQSDIMAQIDDLEASHRMAVYLPKSTLDHLAKMGTEPKELVMSPRVLVENFDQNGGAVVFRNKATATVAERSRDNGTPMQQIIGNLTGAGNGKPADGTHVVQQRDAADNVTRERLVRSGDVEKTKQEFDTPDHLVKVLTPQEALKRREDVIAQELSAKEKTQEGSDAHDHVKTVEDALTAGGIDPRNVNQGDIRRAAEMLADGSATDPIDAYTRAVADNAIHQGYATQEEIQHVFGEEIAGILERDEERPSGHGEAVAPEGTTAGPSVPRTSEENSEPSGGGENGGNEGGKQVEGQPAETGQAETPEHEGTPPAGAESTKPESTGTAAGGEPTDITTGPRGGVAEPQHTEPANGEPGGATDTGATTGPTPERTGAGTGTAATNEPAGAAETPERPGEGGETKGTETHETAGGEAVTGEKPQAGETTGGPRPKRKKKESVEPEAESEEEKQKIADESGEELRGSRKEIWALLHGKNGGLTNEDLDTLTGPERAQFITKENVWRRPDYAALVADNGVEPITAALLKRIYDRLPKKPIEPRWSKWTERQQQDAFVRALRAIRGAISDAKTPKELREKAEELAKQFKDERIEKTPVLAAALKANEYYTNKNPAEYTRQDQRIAQRMVDDGFPNIEPWQRIYRVWSEYKWDSEKHTYVKDDKGERIAQYHVSRKNSGAKLATFDTEAEAIAHAKALYEEQGGSTEGGEIPERPHLANLERNGPDHRKGVDIASGDDFIKEFGFRGSQFGNWVTSQDERQKMLNLAWDALHDLAWSLGMSPKSMSLDGTLGIAFGARGKGGRGAGAAHYEPVERVINMTRINGAGSLAHELFGHAFDHYLGELKTENRYEGAPKGISGWYTQPKESTYKDNHYRLQNLPEGLRKAANELMQAMFYRPESIEEVLGRIKKQIEGDRTNLKGWDDRLAELRAKDNSSGAYTSSIKRAIDARNQWVTQLNASIAKLKKPEQYKSVVETNYFKNAQKLSGKSGDYWKRPTEMFARAAESYVFDKLKMHGRQNDYLVQGVEGDRFRSDGFGGSGGGGYKGNPYPNGEERVALNLLFDELVKHLKSDTGKFEGSKVTPSDYTGRENEDNVYDVIERAKGDDVRQRLIDEALALAGATEKAVRNNLSDAFAAHLEKESFPNILSARKFAAERGFDMDSKKVEEELELGMVKLARQIVEVNNSATDATYAELVAAFDRQPKLATRTSTSMREQAYSTPIPLAYIASRLAGITPRTKVYEPTAGNGALLIEANPTNVTANEINPERRANLKELGFDATGNDASEVNMEDARSFDVVIANPPFGTVAEDGTTKVFDLSNYLKNYESTQVDHAIALHSLENMKNDGKAVLIVGSINKLNAEPNERFNAYQGEAKRLFYKALYDKYNVTDHFTVDGDLYAKQGASWPVDVIVINGIGKSALPLPAVNLPPIFKTWEQLKGLLNGQTSRELLNAAGGVAGGNAGIGTTGGHGTGGRRSPTGGGGRRPTNPVEDEPVDIQPVTDGESESEGADQGGTGGRVKSPEGGDIGGTDVNAETGSGEQRPSGIKKATDEEIQRAIENEINALFGDAKPDDGETAANIVPPPEPTEPPPADKEPKPPEFDPEKYEQIKPSFIEAAEEYPDLFGRIIDLAKALVRHLKVHYKWGNAQLNRMQPYLMRFIKDVQDGIVKLVRQKADRAVPGQHQIPYKPVAEGNGMGTHAPSNLAEAMERGLRKIQGKVGPITDYVASELDIPKERLHGYVGAEQIEALTEAFYNIKMNSAAINGDMTGIGKGRVGAMTAQWAHKNGKVPVFVTDNPSLYKDFYRDLKATGFLPYLAAKGIAKPRILATDAGLSMPLDEEDPTTVIKRQSRKKLDEIMDKLVSPDLVREDYDLIFTSYSQLNPLGGTQEPLRRNFLRMLTPHAVYIFDESHNAAGEAETQRGKKPKKGAAPPPPNRAGFARELVGGASGVSYMSATYAKNPNAMVFYAKTNIRLAVSDPKDLPKLFAKGGIPIQQVVAANLAEDGQFLRRERDMAGINVNSVTIHADHETYDGISKTFGQVNDLANFVKELVRSQNGVGGQVAGGGGSILPDNATGDESVMATGFSSILHNAIAQMQLAMKAPQAAQHAIEAIKRGEKPILGLYNTMESFLVDYVDGENERRMEKFREAQEHYKDGMIEKEPKPPELLDHGSPLTVTFNDILKRYLDRARTIRLKSPEGDVQVHYLTDAQLGKQGVMLYDRAKAQIDSLTLIDMPISPIDSILNDVKKAGYRIGEISGRDLTIDYSGNTPKLSRRPPGEGTQAGKIKTVGRFNTKPENQYNGESGIHAIIMNQAGSTGLSMHASRDFNDQSKRHMMLMQAPPDINIFMQMLGRINRTGQVVLPEYSLMFADLPSEARPSGLLLKKLASLNANTTAARGGNIQIKDMPDFMNHYGDEVAAQFLLENPQYNRMMDYPLQVREDGGYDTANVMHKLTGKLALVYPSKAQDEILDRLTDEYNSLVEQKEAAGENMLEAKVLDLKARPIEGTEVVAAKTDLDSRFATAVVMQRAKVQRVVKPLSHTEIADAIEKSTGVEGLAGKTAADTASNLRMVESSGYNEPHRAKLREENATALKEFAEFRRAELEPIEDAAQQEQARVRLDAGRTRWESLRNLLSPGSRWTLAMDDGNKTAIVLHLDHKGRAANPLALSTWQATFATAEGARTIAIPFSRLFPADGSGESTAPATNLNAIDLRGRQNENYSDTLARFESLQNMRTEQRYIATGNLLAALDWLDGKGRITHYTDYRGDRQQGIIAPHDFDLGQHATQKGEPIQSAQELKDWLDKNNQRYNKTADGFVSIGLDPSSYYRKSYNIRVVANKIDGGVYYLDKDLINIIGSDFASNSVFARKGGRDVRTKVMQVNVPEDRVLRAIDRLTKLGADFRIDKGNRQTIPIDTSDVPDNDAEEAAAAEGAPPPPEGETAANIQPATPRLTANAMVRAMEINRIIRNAVEHILGRRDVDIRFVDNPQLESKFGWGGFEGVIGGSYNASYNILTIAANYDHPAWMASNAMHEAFHGVQNLLLNEAERAVFARELPRLRDMIAPQVPYLSRAQVEKLAPYEVQAIAFEGYVKDRMRGGSGAGLHIGIRRAFEKIMKFFRQIANALRDLGFKTSEDIFESAASGKMSERPSRADKPLQNDIRTQREIEEHREATQARAESVERQKRWAALSEEEQRARLEEAEAAAAEEEAYNQGGETAASLRGMSGTVREKIANLFPYDKRVSFTEIVSDLSHREWLLQKEVEARVLGLTTDEVNKLYPAASKMPDAMQFYVNKRLMPGRVATNVKVTNNKYVKPFVKAAADGNIDLVTLGDYLQAKGAEQRNAQIADAWRDRPTSDFFRAASDPSVVGGSGWSNHDAQDFINQHENGPQGAYFHELWTRFKDMTKHDLELKLRYGLLSQEQVSEFMRRGEDYVPYKGFEDEPENAPDERSFAAKAASPMGVRGKEYREATGRSTRADNPAVHMIDQLYRTIERGEQNAHFNSVAQALAETKAMGNDISDIARLNKTKTKRTIDKNTGLVREIPDTGELNNPRTVHFKRRGRPMFMTFQSRPLAEAIKRTRPPFPKQLRFALIGVNKLKSLWTHYSPTFIPKHFARYYVEGLLNMSEYQGRANGNVSMTEWAKTAFPGLGAANAAINAVENGQTSHPDGRINALMQRYRMMKNLGANQSFRAMRDMDGIRDELSRELDNLTKGRPIKAAKQSLKKVTDAIDHMFDVLTNAQQLATFDQLIRNGTPPTKAAFIARETNVDMQKNGLISHWAGLLFPFFRIAINIGTRFGGAFARSPRYRSAVYAMFAAGAGMALWNYMMGGNDKDGTPFFEKIPSWDRALHMIIMNPWQTDDKGRPMPYKMPMLFNWALPVTFGYHATGMALQAMGAIKSKISLGEHLGDMVKSILMAFTPVGEIGNPLDLGTPEILKGPAHVQENKDWQNRPIHMDEAFQKGPAAYSGKKDLYGRVRTGEAWKEIAQFINWASGGSRTKSGYIDPYPESVRELTEQPFGAQIRFGQDIAKTGKSIMQGEVPKAKDIPLVKVFAGTDYDAADTAARAERYYKSKTPWKQ